MCCMIYQDPVIDKQKLRDYLTSKPIGLTGNTPYDGGMLGEKSGWTVDEWRNITRTLQEVSDRDSPLVVW